LFHGKNKKRSFFEGWYYKLVSADKLRSFAIIPGIFQDKQGDNSCAFIQILDSSKEESEFIEFPLDVFKSKPWQFEVEVGGNTFRKDGLQVNIHRSVYEFSADLSFLHLKPWPVKLLSPGIMGWYSWVPFMECFHGVLSLDHTIQGSISLNGEKIDFSDGKGYIEKDWGTAFPEAWVWQQSNHFSEDEISLTASIAIIPWVRKAFPGFIIGFLWNGQLYRFATYTGAKTTRLEISDTEIYWRVEDKRHILEMHTIKGKSTTLIAPTPNGMKKQIAESVTSRVDIKLRQKIKTGFTLIYQGTGSQAGLEVEGNITKLLQMVENT